MNFDLRGIPITPENQRFLARCVEETGNRQIKINFDGGDLSSDPGLLLIKEFVSKLDIDKLFSRSFKTNDRCV